MLRQSGIICHYCRLCVQSDISFLCYLTQKNYYHAMKTHLSAM